MKCPKCKKEINTLVNIVTGDMEYILSIDEKGNAKYQQKEFENDGIHSDCWCPKCSAVLFKNDIDGAIKFLKKTIKS